jgi:uridine kinase
MISATKIALKYVSKIAMPHAITHDKQSIDFQIEDLNDQSRDDMIKDFLAGKEITIPSPDRKHINFKIKKSDLDPKDLSILIDKFKMYQNKKLNNASKMRYNTDTLSYELVR